MSPKVHVPCGIISGTISYFITHSPIFSISCALSNFIFDIDHVLEYLIYCIKNKQNINIKEFFSGSYFEKKNKIVLIFHGHEYVLLLLFFSLISFQFDKNLFLFFSGILTGYSEHMILDLIGNNCTFKGYSILYRQFVHFKLELICNKKRKLQNE